MLSSSPWLPLLPAHTVRAGAPPVPARLQGEDLVVWRTAAGALQVWHDRCPHRGVRLSLGRVSGERLACAYHGWEFDAGSGRCSAIPALADLAGVPREVHASTCSASESAQMVWVLRPAPANDSAAPATAPQLNAHPALHFLRTLTLRTSLEQLHDHLCTLDFKPLAPCVWQGLLAGQPLRLFSQELQAGLASIHAWLSEAPTPAGGAAAFKALRRLRSDAERIAA